MSLISLLELFWNDFFHTFIEFLYAPIIFPEMLWILIPVILAIVLMEFYFNRYPREGLGNHRSLENTIFLLFIAFDLVRYSIVNDTHGIKLYITFAFILIWIFVAVMDFLHKLPTNFILNNSTKFTVAVVSYVGIVLVYSDILDRTNLLHLMSVGLSIILIFLMCVAIKSMLKYLEPKSYEEIEHFLKNIEDDIKKAAEEEKKEMKKAKSKSS